jgi:hypothetical protein
VTGSTADHRLALKARDVTHSRRIGRRARRRGAPRRASCRTRPPKWLPALRADLQAHRGTAVVSPAIHQPRVHALARAINERSATSAPR